MGSLGRFSINYDFGRNYRKFDARIMCFGGVTETFFYNERDFLALSKIF